MVTTNQLAILMATYNGETYLAEQIESLLGQRFQDWVLYVHDDGSKDATPAILADYQRRYPEKIVLVEGAATGCARNNFFYLLRAVEAPAYMFCDQDDVWLPDKIEKEYRAYRALGETEEPVLVFTDLRIVDSGLGTIAPSLWSFFGFETERMRLESLIVQNVVTGCTVLINRSLRDSMLRFRNMDRLPMHDKWAAMIALRFGRVCRVPEPTILYRQHEENSVGVKRGSGLRYALGKLEQLGKLRQDYRETREQALEFCDAFALDEGDLLRCYGESGRLGKAARLRFYLRHHFYANRASQIIGMILAG